jgi:hypothetical protein
MTLQRKPIKLKKLTFNPALVIAGVRRHTKPQAADFETITIVGGVYA